MSFWLWVLGSAYLVLLGVAAWRSYRRNQSADDYALAGSNVGVFLGFLTFSATLFSTFTLMGMPDFFRTHGVGAWIFLAVSDGAMVFLVVWFGFHLRRKVAEKGFQGMSGLMTACYGSRWAGYVFYAGVFLFLVPYVAIQVRGIAVFLNSAYPAALPAWGWASIIVIVMLIYSEIGGLKAIMYSDVMQGLLLLTMTWVIAVKCIDHFGGIRPMFDEVERVNEALLSVPGPNGLFGIPFLIASFFAILMIPVTQPQLTIRVVVMRNLRATHRMAV
ncbi:MAG: sodium:solute symporter family protein, partial [Bacteroidetes bacterium]